jgi:hypothetical protein
MRSPRQLPEKNRRNGVRMVYPREKMRDVAPTRSPQVPRDEEWRA